MSGSKINEYGSSSATITNFIEVLDADRMAKIDSIGLTNVSTTSVPAIEAASVVECGGSVYRFSTEEPISTGSVASTATATWFIDLVPSSSQITAQFSTTYPSWRTDYQGYYHSTTSNYRTIGRTYFDGTNYNNKMLYMHKGGYQLTGVVHIVNGTNADTNWHANGVEIIESDDTAYLNVRTPNNKVGGLICSDPDAQNSGYYAYDHNNTRAIIGAEGNTQLTINATGLYIGGAVNPSYTLHVAGNGYISSNFYAAGSIFGSTHVYITGSLYSSGAVYATNIIQTQSHAYISGNIESSGYLKSELGRWPSTYLHSGASVTENTVFDAMSPAIPNLNDKMMVHGSLTNVNTGAGGYVISYAEKTASTQISLYCHAWNSTASYASATVIMEDGSTDLWEVSLAW